VRAFLYSVEPFGPLDDQAWSVEQARGSTADCGSFARMKKVLVMAGLLFFVTGIVGLLHPDFTYHKAEEVAHVGPVRATVNEEKVAHVPAAVSVILLVAGLGLTVIGVKRR